MKFVRICLVLMIGFASCKTTEAPEPYGREYYPIQVGSEWTYAVDSIYFNPFTEKADSFTFTIRKTIESIIEGGDGKSKFLAKYETKDSNGLWRFKAYEEIRKSDLNVVEEYENQAMVKLVFPISDRKSWDGNQANNLDVDLFRYRNVDSEYTVAGNLYSTTTTVEQEYDTNFYQVFDRKEVYAENVGMIFKQRIQTEIQFDVKEGYEVAWSLVSFKP